MHQNVRRCIFDTFKVCFDFMREPLNDYELFTQKLSHSIRMKEAENEQFSFDTALDDLVRKSLASHGISGRIFSEESGFYDIPGDKLYRVVYDPFCSSSMAVRAFREGAQGLSFFTYDYQFVGSAILDFHNGLVAVAMHGDKTRFYQVQSGHELVLDNLVPGRLEDAWAVVVLRNPSEREHLAEAEQLLRKVKQLIISTGHHAWLKLAAGHIDVYTDPFGGEELYEMMVCTVAQNAGCVVTNRQGEVFDASKYLRIFEQDRHFEYYLVAARNEALHGETLALLS